MRIVVPFEPQVHPLTRKSLKGHKVEFVRLGEDRTAYWQLLCRLWVEGEPFLVVEHDIEIHERAVADLTECPEPWCLFPYSGPRNYGDGTDTLWYGALGCTRFGADLMEKNPDVLSAIGVREGTGIDPKVYRDWNGLDRRILNRLKDLGYRHHDHWPEVLHHHRYPGGCPTCGHEPCGRTSAVNEDHRYLKGMHMAEYFEYKWTSDWATVFDGYSTPEGTAAVAEPGEKFTTTVAILSVPNVVPVSASAKAAQKAADGPPADGDESKTDDPQTDASGDPAGPATPEA